MSFKAGKPFWVGKDKAREGQTVWSRKRMRLDDKGFFRRKEENPQDYDLPDCEEMDRMLEEFAPSLVPGKQVRCCIQVIS